MAKVTDLKAYWSELAKKNGVDDETFKPILEAMEKESFRKTMETGFKPLPDYSSDLDAVRDRTRKEKEDEYKAWYDEEQKKYAEYVAKIGLVDEYEKRFGRLDQQTQNQNPNPGMTSMTKEEIERLLEAKLGNVLSSRDSAYMDLLEIREEHLSTFKKPLDTKSFEAQWKEHPEWGGTLKTAYKFFVEPEMNKVREVELESKLKQRYEDGIRDGFSRRSLPTDNGSKTFSPFFDRKEDVAKMSESDQERHSREAFLDGLRDSSKQPV